MAEGPVQLGAGSTEGERTHRVSTSTLPCPHPEGPVSSALHTVGQRAESWERLRDHRGEQRGGKRWMVRLRERPEADAAEGMSEATAWDDLEQDGKG